MADLKLCNRTSPHAMHDWGAGPPWNVCPGIPRPEPTPAEQHPERTT